MTQGQGLKIHKHRVLIIDDEAAVGKAIRRILNSLKVESEYAENAEVALSYVEKTKQPFSLIICDQRMPGMKGTEFLARAKEISPTTIRFLITGYSDLDTIINAVNKGAVQHYISKPMDANKMVEAVRTGLRLYEHQLESAHLLSLAKKQNAKLYELNTELVETTQKNDRQRKKLEKEIADIRNQLEQTESDAPVNPTAAIALIEAYANAKDSERQARFDTLYHATLAALYDAFNDLALRNGIELPERKNPEATHD
ncbi:MAG: response regulator [Desulfobacterales bacterium]|nr:response regulator [Desulfobacterales bacterium]